MTLFGVRRWLIIFVENDDENAFLNYVTRIEEVLSKTIRQKIVTCTMNGKASKKLKEIGTKSTANMEIADAFSEALLNDAIKEKKKTRANNLAIVLNRKLFHTEEVFKEVVADAIFDDSLYYAICGRMNFLETDNRIECILTPCKDCPKFYQGCEHSCLARLLWLVFDKDDRVKNALVRMNERI